MELLSSCKFFKLEYSILSIPISFDIANMKTLTRNAHISIPASDDILTVF